MKPERFKPADRLHRRAEIERALREGVRVSDAILTLWLTPNHLEHSRIGIRIPRQVGTAVARNLLRRRLREAFRRHRDALPKGVDLLIQVRGRAPIPYHDLKESLIRLSLKGSARPRSAPPRRP